MEEIKKYGRIVFASFLGMVLIPVALQVSFLIWIGFIFSLMMSFLDGDFIDSPGMPIISFIKEVMDGSLDY